MHYGLTLRYTIERKGSFAAPLNKDFTTAMLSQWKPIIWLPQCLPQIAELITIGISSLMAMFVFFSQPGSHSSWNHASDCFWYAPPSHVPEASDTTVGPSGILGKKDSPFQELMKRGHHDTSVRHSLFRCTL